MPEATAYPPTQEALVEAIAPALPGYNLTADEWRGIMLDLRMKSRTNPNIPAQIRLFYEDLSRAADAFSQRLGEPTWPGEGRPVYLGQEELDKVLGPVGMFRDTEYWKK